MKINNFNLGTLALAAAMTGTLMGAAMFMPPAGDAVVPKASFNISAANVLGAIDVALHVRPTLNQQSGPVASNARPYDVVVVEGLDYDLDAVIIGTDFVPRLQLASMPKNLSLINVADRKKEIFFKTVLPLVLQVNEEITADRQRLKDIKAQIKSGSKLDATNKLWLAIMADRFNTRRGDVDAILARHDVVPPSLALAQAATESAWGTSRFVREGNAMFGQWTFSKSNDGIVPNERGAGKNHRIRAFPSLMESVRSYAFNLNRHRAYREFRKVRATMRAKGGPIDGHILAPTLHRYSERGATYVSELQSIIEINDLRGLDNARLMDIDPLI
ncbi:MAG: glucosaminidase domain-containing protein [Rhodospirillaceae bacterium]|nr:glucosaminidase domain-containing protein [Rhodospirillaceae bacterium]